MAIEIGLLDLSHPIEDGAGLRIDSPNIDDNTDGARPVHTALLGANIPIVEHLTGLDALPTSVSLLRCPS